MDKILQHVGCPNVGSIPVSRPFGVSQVVQDFFNQPYQCFNLKKKSRRVFFLFLYLENYVFFVSWLQKTPMHAFCWFKVMFFGFYHGNHHVWKYLCRMYSTTQQANLSDVWYIYFHWSHKHELFIGIRYTMTISSFCCWGTKFCLKQSAISGGTTLIAADCSSFTLHLGLMLLRVPGHPLNAMVSPKK